MDPYQLPISTPGAWIKGDLTLLEFRVTTTEPHILELHIRQGQQVQPCRLLSTLAHRGVNHHWILNLNFDVIVPSMDERLIIELVKVSKGLLGKKFSVIETFTVLHSELQVIPDGIVRTHAWPAQPLAFAASLSFSSQSDVLLVPLLESTSIRSNTQALQCISNFSQKMDPLVVQTLLRLTHAWLLDFTRFGPSFYVEVSRVLTHLLATKRLEVQELEKLAPLDSNLFTGNYYSLNVKRLEQLLEIYTPFLEDGIETMKTRILTFIGSSARKFPSSPILKPLFRMTLDMVGVKRVQNTTTLVWAMIDLLQRDSQFTHFFAGFGPFDSDSLSQGNPKSVFIKLLQDESDLETQMISLRICALHNWVQATVWLKTVSKYLNSDIEDSILADILSEHVSSVLLSHTIQSIDRESLLIELINAALFKPKPSKFKRSTRAIVKILERDLSEFSFDYSVAISVCMAQDSPNKILADFLMTSYFEGWRLWLNLHHNERVQFSHPDSFHQLFETAYKMPAPDMKSLRNQSDPNDAYEKLGRMANQKILLLFHNYATPLNDKVRPLRECYWIIFQLFYFFPSLYQQLMSIDSTYESIISFAMSCCSVSDLPMILPIISMENSLYSFAPGLDPLVRTQSDPTWVKKSLALLLQLDLFQLQLPADNSDKGVELLKEKCSKYLILDHVMDDVYEVVLKLAGQLVAELSLALTFPIDYSVKVVVKAHSRYSKDLAQWVSVGTLCLTMFRNPKLVIPRLFSLLTPLWNSSELYFEENEYFLQMMVELAISLKPTMECSEWSPHVVPILVMYLKFWGGGGSNSSKSSKTKIPWKLMRWSAEEERMIAMNKNPNEPVRTLGHAREALQLLLDRNDIGLHLLFLALDECRALKIVPKIFTLSGFRKEIRESILQKLDFSSPNFINCEGKDDPHASFDREMAKIGHATISRYSISIPSLYSFYKFALSTISLEVNKKKPNTEVQTAFHLIVQFRAYIPLLRPFILVQSTCRIFAPKSYQIALSKFQTEAKESDSFELDPNLISDLWKPHYLHFDEVLWTDLHRFLRYTKHKATLSGALDAKQFTTFHVALLQLMLDLPLGLPMKRSTKYDRSTFEDVLLELLAWPSEKLRILIFLLLHRIRSEHHYIQYPIYDNSMPTLLIGHPGLMMSFLSFSKGESNSCFSIAAPWRHSFHHSILSIICLYASTLNHFWKSTKEFKVENDAKEPDFQFFSTISSTSSRIDHQSAIQAFYDYIPTFKIHRYALNGYTTGEIARNENFWFPPKFDLKSMKLHFSPHVLRPMFHITDIEWFETERRYSTDWRDDSQNRAVSDLTELNSCLMHLSDEDQLCMSVIYACELAYSLHSWANENKDVIFSLSQLSESTPNARHTGTQFNCSFDFGWLCYALEQFLGPLDLFFKTFKSPNHMVPIAPQCPKRLLWAITYALSKVWDIMPATYLEMIGLLIWYLLQHAIEDQWSDIGGMQNSNRSNRVMLPWNDLERVTATVSAFGPFIPLWPLTDLENLGKRSIPDHVTVIHQLINDEIQNLMEIGRHFDSTNSTLSYIHSTALRIASLLESVSLLILQTLKTHLDAIKWFREAWEPKLKEIQNMAIFSSPPPPSPSYTSQSDGNPNDEQRYSTYVPIHHALERMNLVLSDPQAASSSPHRNVFMTVQIKRTPRI